MVQQAEVLALRPDNWSLTSGTSSSWQPLQVGPSLLSCYRQGTRTKGWVTCSGSLTIWFDKDVQGLGTKHSDLKLSTS